MAKAWALSYTKLGCGLAILVVVVALCLIWYWDTQLGRLRCTVALHQVAVEGHQELSLAAALRASTPGHPSGSPELNTWLPVEEVFPGSNWSYFLVRVEGDDAVCVYESVCGLVCCSHNSSGAANEDGLCTEMPMRPPDRRYGSPADDGSQSTGLQYLY
jgi:hypothetical protein